MNKNRRNWITKIIAACSALPFIAMAKSEKHPTTDLDSGAVDICMEELRTHDCIKRTIAVLLGRVGGNKVWCNLSPVDQDGCIYLFGWGAPYIGASNMGEYDHSSRKTAEAIRDGINSMTQKQRAEFLSEYLIKVLNEKRRLEFQLASTNA